MQGVCYVCTIGTNFQTFPQILAQKSYVRDLKKRLASGCSAHSPKSRS
jgi:hypothetical protein